MATRIQVRRGSTTQWDTANPTLAAGEFGFNTTNNLVKLGDGLTAWADLPYLTNNNTLGVSLGDYINVSEKGSPSGVAELDEDGFVPASQLPPLAKITVNSVANQTARLALTAQQGDIAIQVDTGETYVLGEGLPSFNTSWELITAGDPFPSHTTDNLGEGQTNKYFTDERAQDAVAAALENGTHTNISISYDDENNAISLTGAITYTDENSVDAVATAIANGEHTNISIVYDDENNSLSFTGAQTYNDEDAQDAIAAAIVAGAPHGNIEITYNDEDNSLNFNVLNVTGPTGPTGPIGQFGGATFDYKFSTSTSDPNPSTDGYLNFNNSYNSATIMYIDYDDSASVDVKPFLQTIDDSTSQIKGTFKITEVGNPNNYAYFSIIGSHTEDSTHFHVPVAYVSSNNFNPSNNADVYITFARNGDVGDIGPTGPTGAQGPTGPTGPTGATGKFSISDTTTPSSPIEGDVWLDSATGLQYVYYDGFWVELGSTYISAGPTGPTGATGSRGFIGQSVMPYNRSGVVAISTGTQRFRLPFNATIIGVSAAIGTAPTGAAILIDVNKNGTTIFTNQSNRPIINGGTNFASEVTSMDVTSLSIGDYITVDVDQIGSTIAGADLTVFVRYSQVI